MNQRPQPVDQMTPDHFWQLTPDEVRLLKLMKRDPRLSADEDTIKDYTADAKNLERMGLIRQHNREPDAKKLTHLGNLVEENLRVQNESAFVLCFTVQSPIAELETDEPDFDHCSVCDAPTNKGHDLCAHCEGRGR